jgi:hypothetical protein
LQSALLAELAEATTIGSGMSVIQERVQQADSELQAVGLLSDVISHIMCMKVC